MIIAVFFFCIWHSYLVTMLTEADAKNWIIKLGFLYLDI